jgi:drug/metabolite transporter (DMT)-like permease
MPPRRLLPFAVLAAGVLVVSTASILIRLAQSAAVPSLTIAAARLGIASLLLLPICLARSRLEVSRLSRRDVALALISGAFLALHFWSWISSLEYTSVASSTALVTTNPLWVGLASIVLFQESLRPTTLVGIGLTFAGTGLIFAADHHSVIGEHPDALLGNCLALVGAVCASGYLLIGRALRGRMSLLTYIWLAYSSAAVLLAIAVLVSGSRVLGFTPGVYLLLLLLAIGPQLLGHTSFNWSLRHLSATFVALSILGEPVGSALLALTIFGERLAPLQLAGFLVVLVGIFAASLGERSTGDSRR